MKRNVVGMLREWKTDSERRAPLTPDNVGGLIHRHGLEFKVQPSLARAFPDADYGNAGAVLADDLHGCDFILGIKEVPLDRLVPGRPHLFFSHTIKGQSYNMPLLQRMLELDCTLLDYELVTDEAGRRLIFFGRQAGLAGMLDTLWSLGQRWLTLGFDTPFARLRHATEYRALDEAREAVQSVAEALRREDLPAPLRPVVIGVTGSGNVAQGAHEILDLLRPREISTAELLHGNASDALVAKVCFLERHVVRRRGVVEEFRKGHYRAHPEEYESRFSDYLPHLTALVSGHYWAPRYPPYVRRDDLQALLADSDLPKLTVIGDVTCDVEGSIASTVRPASPENPVYVYCPDTHEARDGFEGPGIQVMAVDILPTEIPVASSATFGRFLSPFLPAIVRTDFDVPLDDLALPAPFKRAVIAHRGSLTPAWRHLARHLPSSSGA